MTASTSRALVAASAPTTLACGRTSSYGGTVEKFIGDAVMALFAALGDNPARSATEELLGESEATAV